MDIEGIRVNINKDGHVILSIASESTILNTSGVNQLVEFLTCAKEDAKEYETIQKKIDSITKKYNGVGRVINVTVSQDQQNSKQVDEIISDEIVEAIISNVT